MSEYIFFSFKGWEGRGASFSINASGRSDAPPTMLSSGVKRGRQAGKMHKRNKKNAKSSVAKKMENTPKLKSVNQGRFHPGV